MGQVIGLILRWDGVNEDFTQEDNYHLPEVVKVEFQSMQNQLAWVLAEVTKLAITWCQWSGN